MKIPGRKGDAGPVLELPPPRRIGFSLAAMTPARRDGDRVEAGEVVAETQDGLPVHSAFRGRVSLGPGRLLVEGEPGDPRPIPPTPRSARGTVEAARLAGLQGMGGGRYPTHRKLELPAEVVIVNGCQSEPYLTCDECVLGEDEAGVRRGLELAMAAVGARRGEIARGEAGYPGGYERLLVERVLGISVPPGARPHDVGALVMNVQTTLALARAVDERRPLVDRVLTIAGGAVARPGNYLVPIGTEIDHLLGAAGVDREQAAAVISGGPMMGHDVGPDAVVTPGTVAVLALTSSEVVRPEEEACIRCGECAEVCPENLMPAALLRSRNPAVLRCIECGACQFVCGAGRPLVRLLRQAKEDLS